MTTVAFQPTDELGKFLGQGVVNFIASGGVDATRAADTFKLVCTSTTPTKAGSILLGDITTCTNGGEAKTVTMGWAETGAGTGIWKLTCGAADQTWTGTGAGFTFRAIVLYDDTPSSPLKPLLGYWDYGGSQAVGLNETITLDLNATFDVMTLTIS